MGGIQKPYIAIPIYTVLPYCVIIIVVYYDEHSQFLATILSHTPPFEVVVVPYDSSRIGGEDILSGCQMQYSGTTVSGTQTIKAKLPQYLHKSNL